MDDDIRLGHVILFTRASCHLCDAARHVLESELKKRPFRYEEIDIDTAAGAAWRERYDRHVPVVHVDGREIARHRLDASDLARALDASERRRDDRDS